MNSKEGRKFAIHQIFRPHVHPFVTKSIGESKFKKRIIFSQVVDATFFLFSQVERIKWLNKTNQQKENMKPK